MRAGRRFAPPLLLGLVFAAGAGCEPPNPALKAWPKYSQAVQGILGEHDQAMNTVAFIDIGLTAPNPPQKGGPTPISNDQAVSQIEKDVIPALEKAAGEAGGIEFRSPNELSRAHTLLVQGLSLKADAYKTLADAYKQKDSSKFDLGMNKLTQADGVMGCFRGWFQEGILDGRPAAPPGCGGGATANPQKSAAPTSTQNTPPIPGLPPIPGQ